MQKAIGHLAIDNSFHILIKYIKLHVHLNLTLIHMSADEISHKNDEISYRFKNVDQLQNIKVK